MVKIAIAGGTGEVAREVLDALVAKKKHEITVLTRKIPTENTIPGVTYTTVDYDDKSQLLDVLNGTHTLLSMIQLLNDPENKAQKNLIDACIAAGVKRFAPSEYASAGLEDMPWCAGKGVIREYLKEVNRNGKVLEYALFQPGIFLDYLAFPHRTSKHLTPLNTMFDFENRRAIVVEGVDATITLTTIHDLANVIAEAVDLEKEWPVFGGIAGNRVKVSQILEVGERVRGRPFTIEKVKLKDLQNGRLTSSWTLQAKHPGYTGDDLTSMLNMVLVGTLLSSAKGAWNLSDAFNVLLPDYKFTGMEEFLARVWEGKP